MFHVLSSSTLNQGPWTPSDRDHSDRYSVRTTLYSDRVELGTTGPKVTTQRALSLSTRFSMLSGKSRKVATVSKDSN